ncbi:hypothetical protein LUD75_09255 [Epilithonimonas sp. JDS]|uniref:hypothetical protein n=1 Tax=Epilithonimonas sp. JDS TaxID=2902797 RepID=UPI001E2D0BB4|nr:hypothetical protein [Epilithonimonas sp. JDS]MCD9854891.1 hypothetical protein [Epilithonimonas sp. JDS]
MGFNIAGLLMKSQMTEQQIEDFLETKITYSSTVDFEEATSGSRDQNTIDVLQTDSGTLIITELGQLYDITDFEGEIIQFMISDVSDTYYFEKYNNKVLERKYIYSQGEIAEDEGSGIITEDAEILDLVWEFADHYLQNDFTKNLFSQKFKRYQI